MTEPLSDELAELADIALKLLAGAVEERLPSSGPPVRWPDLTRAEAAMEWPHLHAWVEHLRVRYPHSLRLPDCWWYHSDFVEALQALRDYERRCFAPSSEATAGVEWQRALRDTESRVDVWSRRLVCAVPGRGHDRARVAERLPDGWLAMVEDDLRRRQR